MKNRNKVIIVVVFISFYLCSLLGTTPNKINLDGSWSFALDSLDIGENEKWYNADLPEFIYLPGTTDTNKKGVVNKNYSETTHLSREYKYIGKAWYQKEISIPNEWEGQSHFLILERTKPTKIWINDEYIGSSSNISTSQTYDLTSVLTPGNHKVTIMVDNGGSIPHQIINSSHAYSENTQTNWNGIIGSLFIKSVSNVNIKNIIITPDSYSKSANVVMKINNSHDVKGLVELVLDIESLNSHNPFKVTKEKKCRITDDTISYYLSLPDSAELWDEFNPVSYKLTATIKGEGFLNSETTYFGLRDFGSNGTQFKINDKITFLRGKHDACVFPLTGHVAMDVDSWRSYFKTAKSYGINYYRFHSWCPPEACFIAADIEGVYLQPELPFWGSIKRTDKDLIKFLSNEGVNILNEYRNHPSFVMFSLGNELSGDDEVMIDIVTLLNEIDDTKLFSTGSNNYLGFKGSPDIDDFFTTCRVGSEKEKSFNTHTRGSFSFVDAYDGGYINHTYPNSIMNFDEAVNSYNKPIIGHETGQFQIYPNYDEISKYKGVLKPRNFEVFKNRLKKSNMEHMSNKFFNASGKLSTLLYRADIEMALRTPGFGGFQLLDLQDYPGQGSAFVGILDAFMESKGLIEPNKWREFCTDVVPLFITEKFSYKAGEILLGTIKVANYSSGKINANLLNWDLKDEQGNILNAGKYPLNLDQGKLSTIGNISSNLHSIQEAQKITLTLEISNTNYRNTYSFWIYPEELDFSSFSDIIIVDELDLEAIDNLENGASILLFPNHEGIKDKSVGGLFQTDYWNYRMFKTISENRNKPVSPGTLGIYTDPKHQLFHYFPTDFHTNWQWFSILKNSRPFILDDTPQNYMPIVQVIDNFERNHKLGLIYEFKIKNGRLLICMSDLLKITEKPEANQLLYSMLYYMNSEAFQPEYEVTGEQIFSLLNKKTEEVEIENLDNISYD